MGITPRKLRDSILLINGFLTSLQPLRKVHRDPRILPFKCFLQNGALRFDWLRRRRLSPVACLRHQSLECLVSFASPSGTASNGRGFQRRYLTTPPLWQLDLPRHIFSESSSPKPIFISYWKKTSKPSTINWTIIERTLQDALLGTRHPLPGAFTNTQFVNRQWKPSHPPTSSIQSGTLPSLMGSSRLV